MTIVTADEAMQAALAGLKEKVEVRDATGNILGYFTPRELEEELLYRYADRVIDPEEIRRRSAAQAKGFTIEQVMAHLKSLEKP
jgi:putative ubiquitin-RnfH superfamily antitoxin RatB of RatAB toxin-antitoxin module